MKLNACTPRLHLAPSKLRRLLWVSCMLPAVACDGARAFSLRAEDETRDATRTEAVSTRLLTDAAALREAMLALQERLSAPVVALEVRIYEDRLIVQVQDPKHPERVVQYRYEHGVLSAPIPVELRGPGQLADNLFPLEEVNFAGVSRLTEQAVSKTRAQGRVDHLVVRRNLPLTMDVRFRVFVAGGERTHELEADADARLVDPS